MTALNNEMNRACRHIFNIRSQYKTLRYLRKNLTQEEIVAHIDFSENYACKYSTEIQAMHFGGSRNLLSLHTGVLYVADDIIPFCMVSDCLRHDPAAIWAHLHPILQSVTSGRKLKSIHFISDGPTTQYRNKNNFYLWATQISNYGFQKSSWNFLEAAHGKGPADGIGATVKRAADQNVIIRKCDITCAKDFISVLRENSATSKVRLYLVSEEMITAYDKDIPDKLQPVPSTMKIHQVSIYSLLPLSYISDYLPL